MAAPQQKSEGEKLISKKGEEKSTEDRERQRWKNKYDGGLFVNERQGEGGSLHLQEGQKDMEGNLAVKTKRKRWWWGEAGRALISSERLGWDETTLR